MEKEYRAPRSFVDLFSTFCEHFSSFIQEISSVEKFITQISGHSFTELENKSMRDTAMRNQIGYFTISRKFKINIICITRWIYRLRNARVPDIDGKKDSLASVRDLFIYLRL